MFPERCMSTASLDLGVATQGRLQSLRDKLHRIQPVIDRKQSATAWWMRKRTR